MALSIISSSDARYDEVLHTLQADGSSTPCVLLGNEDTAKDLQLLKSLGITHIVTASESVGQLFPADFTYHEVPLSDDRATDLSPFLTPCANFMQQALANPHNRVYVHCKVGTSRSVSLLLFYMMRERHYSLRNALLHVMHVRSSNPRAPYSHPNMGFMRQLIACEKLMSGDGTASLTLDAYLSQEYSCGKNISHGPVPPPE